jgi:hypothetical protein
MLARMELRVCAACRQVHAGLTSCPTCHGPLNLTDERLFLGETFDTPAMPLDNARPRARTGHCCRW